MDLEQVRKGARRRASFSPLFIAVGSVTLTVRPAQSPSNTFSPLFIAVGSVTIKISYTEPAFNTFSPLFIAVGSVTRRIHFHVFWFVPFQSTFHRDMGIIDNSNHFVYCFSQIPLRFPQKSDLRR